MNVLKPNYICVKNRCYRSFDGQQESRVRSAATQEKKEPEASKKVASGSEQPKANKSKECEEIDCDVEIIELKELVKESRFLLELDVPRCFRGLVIGAKRQTLNRITSATNTIIDFPPEHQEGLLKILGNSRNDLLSARKRIVDIVDNARQRTDFTHFVAFYARDSPIQQNFKKFRTEILSKYGGMRGVSSEVFQHEHRLHLTFGILVLLGEKERKQAEKLLFNVVQEAVKAAEKKEPVRLRFKGLEYMNDDPSEVHVLYAKVEQISGGIDFQQLANTVVKEFAKSKLMIKVQKEAVKLHLTLMNSQFRNKERITEAYYSKRNREPFDATRILEDFNDFYFGEVTVNEIEILRHTAYDERGYYKSLAKAPLRKGSLLPKGCAVRMILDDNP